MMRGVIPAPPAGADPQTRQWMESVREALSTQLGQRGDPLDRTLSVRELFEAGVITLESNGARYQAPTPGSNGITAAASGDDYNPSSDYSAPAAPGALSATGTANYIVLSWTNREQRNVAHTEIWLNEVDDLSSARLAGVANGSVVGLQALQTNTTYYFWVRFVSHAQVVSDFNAVSGTAASTVAGVPDSVTRNMLSSAAATIGDGEIGNLLIGGDISSHSYAPDGGWTLDRNGSSSFGNVLMRGDVECTSAEASTADIADSLHFKGQSIRRTEGVSARGQVSLPMGGTVTLMSKTIDTGPNFDPASSFVLFKGECGYHAWILESQTMSLYIARNGVVISTIEYASGESVWGYNSTTDSWQWFWVGAGLWRHEILIDHPPPGVHTYSFMAYIPAQAPGTSPTGATLNASERYLILDVGLR